MASFLIIEQLVLSNSSRINFKCFSKNQSCECEYLKYLLFFFINKFLKLYLLVWFLCLMAYNLSGVIQSQSNPWKRTAMILFNYESESKRQSTVWKHIDSSKEKLLGTVVSKEGDPDSVLKHERSHGYWLPWERYNCK